ncbi:hypothetical protein ACRAWG_17080 [Methylobacterium sp. P31]
MPGDEARQISARDLHAKLPASRDGLIVDSPLGLDAHGLDQAAFSASRGLAIHSRPLSIAFQ